jgi:acyl dehydratase
VTYRAPTRPGDELTVRLGELQTAEDGRTELKAECVTQDGTTVVSVTAVLPADPSR